MVFVSEAQQIHKLFQWNPCFNIVTRRTVQTSSASIIFSNPSGEGKENESRRKKTFLTTSFSRIELTSAFVTKFV